MTVPAAFLLFLFILKRAFLTALDLLNLHFLKSHDRVPAEFEGVIDPDTLAKSRSYTADKTVFGIAESVYGDLIFAALILTGLLDRYNTAVFGWRLNFILTGILFFLILGLARTLLDTPADLFRTFRLEAKYGFNTSTPRLWVADFFKGIGVHVALTVLACAAGFWIVQTWPGLWWLIAWVFFFVFSLFLMVVSPYVIEPLFNKFTPLEEGELAAKIRGLVAKTGIRVDRIFIMDASKRSRHTNAYFSGLGPVKRIVLFDTLVKQHTPDEILAVLAHEAGHWKKKHLLKTLAATEILSLGVFYLSFLVIRSEWLLKAFRIDVPTFFANIVLFAFAASLAAFALAPLMNALSRLHEREADDYAVRLVGSGEGLVSSLKKMVKDNLSNLFPHPLSVIWHYSHPPVLRRIEHIRALEKDLEQGQKNGPQAEHPTPDPSN